MKRFLTVSLIAVVACLAATTVYGGEWNTCTPVEVYLADETDYSPLPFGGADSAIGAQVYAADLCFNYNVAEIHFQRVASRFCKPSPFGVPGMPDLEVCCRGLSSAFGVTYRIPWDEDQGIWRTADPVEGGYRVRTFEWDGEAGVGEMRFYTVIWDEESGWIRDPNRILEVFHISADSTGMCTRMSGARRVPNE